MVKRNVCDGNECKVIEIIGESEEELKEVYTEIKKAGAIRKEVKGRR